MAKAIKAIEHTFLKEGKISLRNDDTGGMTYLGVAYNFWPAAPFWPKIISTIMKYSKVSEIQLKTLGTKTGKPLLISQTEIAKINAELEPIRKDIIAFYKKDFWDILNADIIISQTFADSFFDFCVNAGAPTGKKLLQTYLGVEPDGNIGPVTIAKLNSEIINNLFNVHIDFSIIKINRYMAIVNKNSAQKVNLHGWINRTLDVFDTEFDLVLLNTLYNNPKHSIASERNLTNDIKKLLDIKKFNDQYKKERNLDTFIKNINSLFGK